MSVPVAAPNRAARRATASDRKVLFETGLERLTTMAERGPFSIASLNRYWKSGQLETVKVAGARCVSREAWKAFIAGTPDDGADLAGEIA